MRPPDTEIGYFKVVHYIEGGFNDLKAYVNITRLI